MSEKALTALASESALPSSGELNIQKQWLEASAYTSLEQFPEAEKRLGEIEHLCAISTPPTCADLRVRGWLEKARGHFQEAQRLFERTVAFAHERDDSFLEASTLLDLCSTALQEEHFDEAQDWSAAAQRVAAAIGAGHIVQTALGNQGWAYYKLGEPEKALGLFLDAAKRAHDVGADTYEVAWLTTAGYVFLDAHEYEKAEQYYLQGLELAKRLNRRQDVIDTTMSLALVSERTGKLDQARDYADKTIALAPPDGNRLDILYPMLVKGHVAARQRDFAQAEKIFRDIEQDPKSHTFLKWESAHSLAQLYEDENKPDSANSEYRAALSTFETARCSLQHEESSLPFPANALSIYDDYIHFLVSTGKTSDALQVAEYDRGQTLAEGLGLLKKCSSFKPNPPNAQATARKAGGTILFYWLGDKESYLWAINPQKTNLLTLPAKSKIDPVVQRYRKALADQQEFMQEAGTDGRWLYQTLVAPAQAMLPKDGKVFIIPDGSLNTLNFETVLVGDQNPHYWIEDATIADANSLHLLAASHAAAKHAGTLLLMGNAVSPNPDYPELRKATTEMESIEKNFSSEKQKTLAREQATPAAYLASKPEQFSYIHFVAHGTASRTSPLDSAIVLSKASKEDDSFKLYARDIIHRRLGAELVTISTCYGAGARAYSGEGLVGLSWAFLRAGAHNVIGALWEVSDVSTPQLMGELYGELKDGKGPDSALRAAKLSLLHSKGAFSKPFYWAPFQLYTGS